MEHERIVTADGKVPDYASLHPGYKIAPLDDCGGTLSAVVPAKALGHAHILLRQIDSNAESGIPESAIDVIPMSAL
ncbi:hypothetical protein, partial [Bradyrhizobium sp. NAS96.2]|uniref:hypothetical protein n=1 Tax=Bradyrhizobium sp. NAS96.2 TaxID=1680160 RepID=UPI001AECFF03